MRYIGNKIVEDLEFIFGGSASQRLSVKESHHRRPADFSFSPGKPRGNPVIDEVLNRSRPSVDISSGTDKALFEANVVEAVETENSAATREV